MFSEFRSIRGEMRVYRSVLSLLGFNDTCNLQTYYCKFQFLCFMEISEARLDFLQPGRGVAKLLARFCLFIANSPLTCTNMSLQSLSTYKCAYYTNIYFTSSGCYSFRLVGIPRQLKTRQLKTHSGKLVLTMICM